MTTRTGKQDDGKLFNALHDFNITDDAAASLRVLSTAYTTATALESVAVQWGAARSTPPSEGVQMLSKGARLRRCLESLKASC